MTPEPATAAAVAPVILGTMTFADTVDEAEAAAIVSAALEEGVNWIDTANVYVGGETERMLARILPNDGIVLATKVGMDTPDLEGHRPLSAAGIDAAFTASLRRLERERVDLLYLHTPDYGTDIAETVDTLAALMDRGQIGGYGVSNYAAWQVAVLMVEADRAGLPHPVVAQQLYNPIARSLDDEWAAFAQWAGLQTTVYNPLAGGLLARRRSRDSSETSGRFGDARIASIYRERYWHDRFLDAAAQLADIAEAAGASPAEATLRWVASRPVVDSIILGASSAAQLQANLRAIAAGPLDQRTTDEIDALGADLTGSPPRYNR